MVRSKSLRRSNLPPRLSRLNVHPALFNTSNQVGHSRDAAGVAGSLGWDGPVSGAPTPSMTAEWIPNSRRADCRLCRGYCEGIACCIIAQNSGGLPPGDWSSNGLPSKRRYRWAGTQARFFRRLPVPGAAPGRVERVERVSRARRGHRHEHAFDAARGGRKCRRVSGRWRGRCLRGCFPGGRRGILGGTGKQRRNFVPVPRRVLRRSQGS